MAVFGNYVDQVVNNEYDGHNQAQVARTAVKSLILLQLLSFVVRPAECVLAFAAGGLRVYDWSREIIFYFSTRFRAKFFRLLHINSQGVLEDYLLARNL